MYLSIKPVLAQIKALLERDRERHSNTTEVADALHRYGVTRCSSRSDAHPFVIPPFLAREAGEDERPRPRAAV